MKKKQTLGIAFLAAAVLCFLAPAKARAAELTGGPTSGFSAKKYYEILKKIIRLGIFLVKET